MFNFKTFRIKRLLSQTKQKINQKFQKTIFSSKFHKKDSRNRDELNIKWEEKQISEGERFLNVKRFGKFLEFFRWIDVKFGTEILVIFRSSICES